MRTTAARITTTTVRASGLSELRGPAASTDAVPPLTARNSVPSAIHGRFPNLRRPRGAAVPLQALCIILAGVRRDHHAGAGAGHERSDPGSAGRSETHDEVTFTNLDEPLFAGADASKRDVVDYLDAMTTQLVTELRDRPLSVIRVLRGQQPFMQKNVPAYAPSWIRTVRLWAESSKRDVSYALCNDRRTLLWFANQRAIEYHPALVRIDDPERPLYLVLDIDPPSPDDFKAAVQTAHLVRQALADCDLVGAVKTSGSKGIHVFVPLAHATFDEAAAATRALAARAETLDTRLATTAFMKENRRGKVFIDATRVGGATVAAAYSPRARPGVPVSFPVAWDDLDRVSPMDFTIKTAASLGESNPWLDGMPAPQVLGGDLVDEGRAIPVARVQAMHEGKRRARWRSSTG